MNEQQFQALMEYVDARIEEKIREYGSWYVLAETLRTLTLRGKLRKAFGLPADLTIDKQE